MPPYWLLAGLSPAQGANVGAFTALGMGISSVAAFRKTGHLPKDVRLTALLSVATIIASIIGALVLPKVDMSAFKTSLAILTIVSLPLLFIKPPKIHRFAKMRTIGIALMIPLLIISSVLMSSAFSVLIAIVLISFLGLSTMQTTALRRLVTLSQSTVLFIVLTAQGFFVWQHAVAGVIGGSIGSYAGTKFAIAKGESFARYALAVGGLVGAILLLV
jgi:uncharacterized membrane protein YfcA